MSERASGERPSAGPPTAELLAPTYFLDGDSPSVRAFTEEVTAGVGDGPGADVARGVRLFHAVRDRIRYDPYSRAEARESYRASTTLAAGAAFCVPKAILLAAAARVAGVPSRVGFADVRNHLTTERLRARMKTDLFVFHGYTQLHLAGRWVKATPTFNLSLCERFGVKALDFDGTSDALFHPFDVAGNRHMEYVRDHGVFDDFPYELATRTWTEVYGDRDRADAPDPDVPEPGVAGPGGGDFEAEAAAEAAAARARDRTG